MENAGGVKTTSIAVMFMTLVSNLRGKKRCGSIWKKVRENYIRSAVVVVGIGFSTLVIMTLLLAASEHGVKLEDIAYEVTSALGTVGLSRNLTPKLSTAGQ